MCDSVRLMINCIRFETCAASSYIEESVYKFNGRNLLGAADEAEVFGPQFDELVQNKIPLKHYLSHYYSNPALTRTLELTKVILPLM